MKNIKMINDKLPIWLEEAKDLKDRKSIWDWIKFNVRTVVVGQHFNPRSGLGGLGGIGKSLIFKLSR